MISTDEKYPGIIDECVRALEAVIPTSIVGIQRHHDARRLNVITHSKRIVCMFPQHAPGRKHERVIELAPWQRDIVRRHPEALIRGLIHSDGCRFLNRVQRPVAGEMRGYTYPRYMFSNNSLDIQRIFTDALDQLGNAWRNSRWNCISIARRADVARLDTFVGPTR